MALANGTVAYGLIGRMERRNWYSTEWVLNTSYLPIEVQSEVRLIDSYMSYTVVVTDTELLFFDEYGIILNRLELRELTPHHPVALALIMNGCLLLTSGKTIVSVCNGEWLEIDDGYIDVTYTGFNAYGLTDNGNLHTFRSEGIHPPNPRDTGDVLELGTENSRLLIIKGKYVLWNENRVINYTPPREVIVDGVVVRRFDAETVVLDEASITKCVTCWGMLYVLYTDGQVVEISEERGQLNRRSVGSGYSDICKGEINITTRIIGVLIGVTGSGVPELLRDNVNLTMPDQVTATCSDINISTPPRLKGPVY